MVSKSRKNLKGGNNLLALTPADCKGVGDLAVAGDANFVKPVNAFSSTLVGGRRSNSRQKQRGGMAYGFSNAADVPVVAGSYIPITPICTGSLNTSRGGNNFTGGGMRGGLLTPGGGGMRGGLLTPGGGGMRGGLLTPGGGSRKRKSRRSNKRSKSNKRSNKRSKSKRSNKTKKWWQVGCNKKFGGSVVMM